MRFLCGFYVVNKASLCNKLPGLCLNPGPTVYQDLRGEKSIFFLVSTGENAEPHLGMRKLLATAEGSAGQRGGQSILHHRLCEAAA